MEGKPLVSEIQMDILRYFAVMCLFRGEEVLVLHCMIAGEFLADPNVMNGQIGIDDTIKQSATIMKERMARPKDIKAVGNILRRYMETDAWNLRKKGA